MKKTLFFLCCSLWLHIQLSAQTTAIPDANFEQALIDLGIDSDGTINQQVATADVSSVSSLSVSGKSIADLTGIEAFTNLTTLHCYNNQLTALDVSNNSNLTTLQCYSNQLTALDVSNNSNLTTLQCYSNQLTALDVSNNSNLTTLQCYSNQLTALDVSLNSNLTELYCFSNQLTALDVSLNSNLTRLHCGNNPLTALDISQNSNLIELNCDTNQLTTLDVSNNSNLIKLLCYNNQLTTLDVSNNSNLTTLLCYDNQLTALDIKNGNNTNFTFFSATSNVDLTCVVVDDPDNVPTTISNGVDNGVTFVALEADCPSFVDIPDANFERALISLGIDSDVTVNQRVASADVSSLSSLDVFDQNIADLTGIEAFTSLEFLNCAFNDLTALDVSQNSNLTELQCTKNQLTALDVSQNSNLAVLGCTLNQLTALDVSQNSNLTELYCGRNQLTALDVSQNSNLIKLYCFSNQLTALDVSQNSNLTELGCYNNQLTALDVSQNSNLTKLQCHNNQLTALDVANNANLIELQCHDNQLTVLDVANNSNLTTLHCHNNQLTALDVSQNSNLTTLHCHNNQLTTLDVSQNSNLTTLQCHNNQLTALNIKNGNNANFTSFSAINNVDLNCVVVDDPDNVPTTISDGVDNGVTFAAVEANCNCDNPPSCDPLPFMLNLAGPISIMETTGSNATATFTITRSGNTSEAAGVEFIFRPFGVDPVSAADFIGDPLSGQTVAFAADETTQTVIVTINDDNTPEKTETFYAIIQNITAGGSYENSFLKVRLLDNDSPPVGIAGSDILSSCDLTVGLGVFDVEETPASGIWTIVSGDGGSFANANEYYTDFTGVADRSYLLRWTDNSDNSSDEVCVTFSGDSDNDGVNDCEDRCPFFDDNIDSDMDGAPDACDCDPTSAADADIVLDDGTMVGGSIPTGMYESSGTIESTGTVANGSDVTYKAAVSITLKAGFSVEAGGLFRAYIAPCTYNPDYQVPAFDDEEVTERFAAPIGTDLPTDFRVTAQPNPARDIVQIGFELSADTPVSMDVFDVMGKRIAMPLQQQTRPAGKHLHGLNVSHLQNGIYYVRVQTKDAQQVVKIIVQH